MGLVARFFGKGARDSEEPGLSRLQSATREQTRREVTTMALRDTLRKHGLAVDCITADGLSGIMNGRHRGMHVQLVFRDWQPSLLSYIVALEQAFKERLRRLDPLSQTWMLGISWRFDPEDPTSWPKLPATNVRKPAGVAESARAPSRSTELLDAFLQSGDQAFRQKIMAHADFSPTLPMARK